MTFTSLRAKDWRERIVCTPDTLSGKPRIADSRISVALILGLLADGWTHAAILESYPHIARGDIVAALAFAADAMETTRRTSEVPPQNALTEVDSESSFYAFSLSSREED